MSETLNEAFNEVIPEVGAAELKAMIADHRMPLLVEYMADHCVWCQRLEPVLAATMDKFNTRVQLVKIDVELHPDAKPTDTPRSIPTIALYRDGRLIMTKSGMMQRQQLESFLTHWLNPANEGLN
ncbi:thioredoxin family protein [Nevskia ramosa]|uniref:thioredoxin family protein n=1 Tax=Nevskia ramosa TaxID=64002 RepID=UPI0003B461E8|nr:thioredoxin family protein [Nevskia ramosa]